MLARDQDLVPEEEECCVSSCWCEGEVCEFILYPSVLQFRLQQHPRGPVGDPKAGGGCWVGGDSGEDARGC